MFLVLRGSYTYQFILQLFHNCLLMFCVLYLLFILVSVLVHYSCLLFFVCMCCPVLTSFILSCPRTGTGFFKHIYVWMFVCMSQYWNISPLPLYSMLLSLFSSRTRASTSPDNTGQPSSFLRRIFSIQSQRLVQYYRAMVLNLIQERRKMLQI